MCVESNDLAEDRTSWMRAKRLSSPESKINSQSQELGRKVADPLQIIVAVSAETGIIRMSSYDIHTSNLSSVGLAISTFARAEKTFNLTTVDFCPTPPGWQLCCLGLLRCHQIFGCCGKRALSFHPRPPEKGVWGTLLSFADRHLQITMPPLQG
eukprot:3044765-Ditylum_brightwellii.AAC.1